ncbi:MAG TPA: hypothetical protein PLO67_18780 [Saprospiraceae bacterium]|nr:hypothetical protein [Saprospiraceae bacterium]HPI07707.1 hypothetical protein [Saprospiraceae bacterium]
MKHFSLLLFLFTTASLFGQDSEPNLIPAPFSVWSQRMDMSRFAGKKYRLTVAIRAEPIGPDAFAVAFIRNESAERKVRNWTWMDNMFDRPVRDSSWEKYTLEGIFDKKAPFLGFGCLGFNNGNFYFDDFQLSVEVSKGTWNVIPVENGQFEMESLDGWDQTSQGVPARVLGAKATLSTEKPYEGKACLLIENNLLLEKK